MLQSLTRLHKLMYCRALLPEYALSDAASHFVIALESNPAQGAAENRHQNSRASYQKSCIGVSHLRQPGSRLNQFNSGKARSAVTAPSKGCPDQ